MKDSEPADRYRDELLENVVPFWTKYAPDLEYGGFFTCLDRAGAVYDTEKFMWMQWRIVWMYCELCHAVQPSQEWLDLAMDAFEFLTRHGKDEQGRYYFSLARDGTPATSPYSVFSECFAAMGSAALYRVTGDSRARAEAVSACEQYVARKNNPKGSWEKTLSGKGNFQSLGYFMMQANLGAVLADCLGEKAFPADVREVSDTVLSLFWNDEKKMLFENVPAAGGFDIESMTGRHLNPGHALEAMWFLMEAAACVNDRRTIDRASEIILATLDHAWDKEYGGLYYFMDACDRPHVELQWDMKLWWVHCEAMIATLMAHKLTGRQELKHWFDRLHDWTWAHYPDPEFGDWFGYLDRRGEVTHQLKGGKWKTLFHLPRMLLKCSALLKDTDGAK